LQPPPAQSGGKSRSPADDAGVDQVNAPPHLGAELFEQKSAPARPEQGRARDVLAQGALRAPEAKAPIYRRSLTTGRDLYQSHRQQRDFIASVWRA